MKALPTRLSLSRDSILPAVVIIALLAALPFATWEFIQTGELYIFSHRFWPDPVARFHGPGRMRFIMQPTVATFLGARDGVKDRRADKPPFLWGLVFRSADRPGYRAALSPHYETLFCLQSFSMSLLSF